MRPGEWLGYTIQVSEPGAYTVLLMTDGAAKYLQPFSSCWNSGVVNGWAHYHLELDGHRVTPNLSGESRTVAMRIWIPAGIHQLRLALDSLSSFSGLTPLEEVGREPLNFYTFAVDWVEIMASPTLLAPTVVAGGVPGFRDGWGADAGFGTEAQIIGESPSGDAVLVDPSNAAIRLASGDGHVQTLAGHPGNPPRDGLGTNAGFGSIRHSVVTPSGDVLVLEAGAADGNRIARVDVDRKVTTLFSGIARTPLERPPDVWPQWPVNTPVSLSRIESNERGEVDALGEFIEYTPSMCGGVLYYYPIPWHARFRIADGNASVVTLQSMALPPSVIGELGEGYHLKDTRIFIESPSGFFHDVLRGIGPVSALRARDGTLWAASGGVFHRLSRDPGIAFLNVFSEGDGHVVGDFFGQRRTGDRVRLEAVRHSRFTQFAGWSDGSVENPRVVEILHDTALTALFEVRYPEPCGIDPQSAMMRRDGYFEFKVIGAEQPYFYKLEQSMDLKAWQPVPPGAVGFKPGNSGRSSLNGGLLSAGWPEVWLQALPRRSAMYYRALIQNY